VLTPLVVIHGQNNIDQDHHVFWSHSMFDFIKRAVGLSSKHRSGLTRAKPALATQTSASPDLSCWHGDHWANLLSSPMDARHYVLEDWGVADFGPKNGA
jgi:hypothetical protein